MVCDATPVFGRYRQADVITRGKELACGAFSCDSRDKKIRDLARKSSVEGVCGLLARMVRGRAVDETVSWTCRRGGWGAPVLSARLEWPVR